MITRSLIVCLCLITAQFSVHAQSLATRLDDLATSIDESSAALEKSGQSLEGVRASLYREAQKAREVKMTSDALNGVKQPGGEVELLMKEIREYINLSVAELRILRDRSNSLEDIIKELRSRVGDQEKQLAALRVKSEEPGADAEELGAALEQLAGLEAQLASANQKLGDQAVLVDGLNAEKARLEGELAMAQARADVASRAPDADVDYIEKGYAALAAGMLEDAVFAFRSELVRDPSSIEARIGLASYFFERENLIESRKLVDQVLELDERNARALGLRGALKFRDGDLGAAQSDLKRALKIDENSAYNRNYLGVVYQEMDRMEDAVEQIRRAVELDPEYLSAHFNLAVILATSETPDLAAASASYQRYLALGGSPNPELEAYIAGN